VKVFDYNEDVAYEKAMKASLKESTQKSSPILLDPSLMKKLLLKCSITIRRLELSEELSANGYVILNKKDIKSCGKIKTTVEHAVVGPGKTGTEEEVDLVTHFPDICGFACIVCRKTEKSKKHLIKHLETAHSKDILEMLGVSNLELYEQHFSTNSDEQINLRAEEYVEIVCDACKKIFYSAERMTMHAELGQCEAKDDQDVIMIEEDSEEEEKAAPAEYLADYENTDYLYPAAEVTMNGTSSPVEGDEEAAEDMTEIGEEGFHPFDSLETHYSDEDDDDDDDRHASFNRALSNNLRYEQLSVSADYPGLKECLSGEPPYCCVIPSCNKRPYPNASSLRRHLATHDPEMYAYLICPICKYVRSDDHPGDMRKHIMNNHGMDEDWARENVIADISEKLIQFRKDTGKVSRQPRSYPIQTYSTNTLYKVPISLDDPAIRASFTAARDSDNLLSCGVSYCSKKFKSAHNLKQHYAKHDDTLRINSYQCMLCPQTAQNLDYIRSHVITSHPQGLFLLYSGEIQWRVVKNIRWEQFSEQAAALIEETQQLRRAAAKVARQQRILSNSVSRSWCKVAIMMEDPAIRASFTEDKDSDSYLVCGITQCAKKFKSAESLKHHYAKHDDSLRSNRYECNFCIEKAYHLDAIRSHIEIIHPELLDSPESEIEFWRVSKGERFEEFSEQVNAVMEENQHFKEEVTEPEDYEMIHAICTHCSLTFNTKNAYLDHDKVHQPDLVNFKCKTCQEGFIVKSVFINHVKGHKIPYTAMKCGSIRCNGCSQLFVKKADVKDHLKNHHMNLLNNCLFCDHCSAFFFHKKYFEKHMFSHIKKVFRCQVCKKRFLNQEDANLHISAKRCKAKSYICPHGCEGKFSRVGLVKHKKYCKEAPENNYAWDRDW